MSKKKQTGVSGLKEKEGRGRPGFLILLVLVVLVAAVLLVYKFWLQPGLSWTGFWKKQGVGRPNVLLITLDTTRADHLPLYGYNGVQTPHLNELGQRGVVFEQCATTMPLTLPAHCSILTGYYPPYHGVRVNGNNA
ncbi:MAG: sulfatase-like hydrolase/transferase, partial [Candidatus Saccharicenans sp.]|nr:sulfatase-like hydrolase/transferase [Candidatus Saccharicenans sp.]